MELTTVIVAFIVMYVVAVSIVVVAGITVGKYYAVVREHGKVVDEQIERRIKRYSGIV